MVGVEPMAPPIPEEGAYPEDSDVFHDNVFTEEPHPPTMVGGGQCTSHVSPSNGHVTPPDGPVPPPVIVRKKRRSSSLERPLSYQMATEEVTLYFEEECLLTSATAHSQEHLVEPSGVPLGGGGDGEQGDQLQREGCAQEVSSQASQEGGDVATGHTSPGSSDASPSHVMDSTHSSQEEAGVGGLEPPDLGPSLRPSLASTRDSQVCLMVGCHTGVVCPLDIMGMVGCTLLKTLAFEHGVVMLKIQLECCSELAKHFLE